MSHNSVPPKSQARLPVEGMSTHHSANHQLAHLFPLGEFGGRINSSKCTEKKGTRGAILVRPCEL